MLARAIALASVLGEDAAPLEVLPEPARSQARAARDRLSAVTGGARAALLARETLALFAPPPSPEARRVLPRALAIAIAPPEPAPPSGPLPGWLATALPQARTLGLYAIARASAEPSPAAAELLRRLTAEEASLFVAARRTSVDEAAARRARAAVTFCRNVERELGGSAARTPLDDGGGSWPRRVGLARLSWAASVENGALAALAGAVAEPERPDVLAAGRALWFAASEQAAAERASIVDDLERAR